MSNKNEAFYNRFSLFYPLVDFFLRPQKRLLLDEINCLPFGQLLEIGIGSGAHLRQYTSHRITGVDTSAAMLALADKNKSSNVELLQMNGENLEFADDTFDYVVLSHVIAVVDHPNQLMTEASRVLRPNGRLFILNHFTPNNSLKYLDRSFQFLSRRFHFRSVFYTQDLEPLNKLLLLKEVVFGPFSYFKLLIFKKL